MAEAKAEEDFEQLMRLLKIMLNSTRDSQSHVIFKTEEMKYVCTLFRHFEYHPKSVEIMRTLFYILRNLSSHDDHKMMVTELDMVDYLVRALASSYFVIEVKYAAFDCLFKMCDKMKKPQRNPVIVRLLTMEGGFGILNLTLLCKPPIETNVFANKIPYLYEQICSPQYQPELVAVFKNNPVSLLHGLLVVYTECRVRNLKIILDRLIRILGQNDRDLDAIISRYLNDRNYSRGGM